MNRNPSLRQKQSGIVFVTGLIFLLILTLLGVSAVKTASIEERMSGNLRDRHLALQAAEMGLRYAEQYIRNNNPAVPPLIVGVTGFDATCTNGLCYYGEGVDAPTVPVWTTYCTPDCPISYHVGNTFSVNNVVTYTAPALPAGVPAPTYLIEGIRKIRPGSVIQYYYRITVRGQGAKPGTTVWLQEVFKP
ncbi:type IV pilus assembly protein PilX [Nitrosomonas cryotolerans]|uniref:Type IV pilus assembly protein PilX n=1 Tax=Nitrosomonas cryotolerans ATCC 49181 TaxID=1131553 RepID=A0A1N6FK18_9PROT|nr:PilX N-terminal domain-containing pilus assembly protein [Nitrosomonas cryotolerans]SFP82078.1 type IV pilus assembly protein PilX [Nitrosomonas cryotolerans]SIN95595.1 type IV pilus assembly protein PilX [Nitrosomonas cryotolerans ATCC 49181]